MIYVICSFTSYSFNYGILSKREVHSLNTISTLYGFWLKHYMLSCIILTYFVLHFLFNKSLTPPCERTCLRGDIKATCWIQRVSGRRHWPATTSGPSSAGLLSLQLKVLCIMFICISLWIFGNVRYYQVFVVLSPIRWCCWGGNSTNI